MSPLLFLILGSVFSYNTTEWYSETSADFKSGTPVPTVSSTSVSKVTLLSAVYESIFVIIMLTSIITILLSDI